MNKILKGDTVQVIAGNDKGKKGEVFKVMPKEGRALVFPIEEIRQLPKGRGLKLIAGGPRPAAPPQRQTSRQTGG